VKCTVYTIVKSFAASFLMLAINASVSPAQANNAIDALRGLSSLSDADIREYAIAFVNMTTSPGLEGMT